VFFWGWSTKGCNGYLSNMGCTKHSIYLLFMSITWHTMSPNCGQQRVYFHPYSHTGVILTGESRWTLGEKLIPVSLCPPQLNRARTVASVATGRRVTAWAMARH
jgi:hypothetical protein